MTKILKKDGVEIMGECTMPNPLPWWVEQVTQATKEVQREALTSLNIEDDAIAQLEADDRFACGRSAEYTVDEIVDLVARLYADCECCRKLIKSGLATNNVAAVLEAHWINCEAELKRLKAGRVVV